MCLLQVREPYLRLFTREMLCLSSSQIPEPSFQEVILSIHTCIQCRLQHLTTCWVQTTRNGSCLPAIYRTQLHLFGVAVWLVPEHSYRVFLPALLRSAGNSVVSSKKIPLWSRASIFPGEPLAPGRGPGHPSPFSCLNWMIRGPFTRANCSAAVICIKYDMVVSSKPSFCSSKLHKFWPWPLRFWQIDLWDGYSVSTMKSEFA